MDEELLSEEQWAALGLSLDEIGIPQRVLNALEEKGVSTVRELLMTDFAKLKSIRNFGAKTIDHIYGCLAEVGFKRGQKLRAPEPPALPPPKPYFTDDYKLPKPPPKKGR